VARGGGNERTLDESVLAHTSPVYLDVAGQRVGRRADAQWCLDYLDQLQALIERHAHLAPERRAERVGGFGRLLDEARDYYRAVRSAST
jgi:hypothetical protein